MNQCFEKIPDLLDSVASGDITLIPLRHNSKIPANQGWNTQDYSLQQIAVHTGNIGILIANGLGCIDIDGSDGSNPRVKEDSRALLGKILVEEFKDCLIVKTANEAAGFHIYFRIDEGYEIEDAHRVSQTFQYPFDFDVEELRNCHMGNAIEVFAKQNLNRQMVFVGSEIDGRKYELLPDGCQKISDIPIINNVEERIEKALLYNGFTTYTPPAALVKTQTSEADKYKHSIPSYFIDRLADYIIEILDFNYNNGKHSLVLYLGGYLSNYITTESLTDLGYVILDKVRDDYFKDNTAFMHTLTKSEQRKESNVGIAGGNALYQTYVEPMGIDRDVFFGRIAFLSGGKFFFYPSGQNAGTFKRIDFDQYHNRVNVSTCGFDKDNNIVTRSITNELNIIITRVEEQINPLRPEDARNYVVYYVHGQDTEESSVSGTKFTDIFNDILNRVGVVGGSGARYTINNIITRYRELGLVDKVETSPIPGIMYVNNEIRRYDVNGQQVPIEKVDPAPALELLDEIRKIIPWSDSKFGHVVRAGLGIPFRQVFREFGIPSKYLLLGGEGGSYKSTCAELLLNFYEDVYLAGPYANVFSAGDVSTEYRLGDKYSRSLNGFVVNEIGTMVNDPSLLEILKAAIEGVVARQTHTDIYYSYQTAIFTANIDLPNNSAFLRRTESFYMHESDRITPDIEKQLRKLLNIKGQKNIRFKELRAIGDYCVYIIKENLEKLETMTLEDVRFFLVDELQKTTDIDLSYMKSIEYDQQAALEEEVDSIIISGFIKYVSDIYNKDPSPDNMLTIREEDGHGIGKPFSIEKLDRLVKKRKIHVLESCVFQDNEYYLLTQKSVKEIYKNSENVMMTIHGLWGEFKKYQSSYDIHEPKQRRLFNYRANRARGILLTKEFIIDLLNNDIILEDNNVD